MLCECHFIFSPKRAHVNDFIYIKFTKGTRCDFYYQPDWSNRDWIYRSVWSNSKLRWNRLNKSSQDIRHHQVMRDDEPKRQEIARWASAPRLEGVQAEGLGGEQSGAGQTLGVTDLGAWGDQGDWTLQGRVQEGKELRRELWKSPESSKNLCNTALGKDFLDVNTQNTTHKRNG